MMIQVPRIYGFVQCFDNFTVGQLFACATWAGSFLFFLMYIRLMWTRQKALLKLASATTVKFFVRYPAQKRFLYNVFKCLLAIHMLSAIYIDYLFVLGSVETSENPKKLSSQLRKSWHTRLCVIASDYKLNFLISMNTFFFVLVLALYFVRIEIERSILQQPFDVGVCILDALRKRIDYVNEAVGDMLLAFYLATVSHYCEYPEVIGTNYYKEHSYSVLIFFIGTGITWIMGAHFHHNITRLFIKWAQAQLSGTKHPQLVNKYVNTSSNLQMTVLSMLPEAMVSRRDIILFKRTAICNDLALEPIALSCSLFSVTNGLVCSVKYCKTFFEFHIKMSKFLKIEMLCRLQGCC